MYHEDFLIDYLFVFTILCQRAILTFGESQEMENDAFLFQAFCLPTNPLPMTLPDTSRFGGNFEGFQINICLLSIPTYFFPYFTSQIK